MANTITLKIEGDAIEALINLTNAINELANKLSGNTGVVSIPVNSEIASQVAAPTPVQQPAQQTPPGYPIYQQQTSVVPAAVPVQQAPVMQQSTVVPTATPPAYNFDTISTAAAPLVGAGKQAELVALLQSFGVQALTQLPESQYGEFATGLRALGARI